MNLFFIVSFAVVLWVVEYHIVLPVNSMANCTDHFAFDSNEALAAAVTEALGGRATAFIGVSGAAVEHEIAFTHRVLGCNGLYNSFSLGPKISFDSMPFGFENHLIFGSINFRQDHMEKAIRMLAESPYDRIVELIGREEFAADPIGAYENRIYCKNAPMKTAVIWNPDRINLEG